MFVEHPGYTGSVKDHPAKVCTYGLVSVEYKTFICAARGLKLLPPLDLRSRYIGEKT